MSLFQAGGVAALICAATYIMGFVLLVTVLAPLGYGSGALDAASVVAFIHARPALMLIWNMLIYCLNAIALTVLVVALSERLRPASWGWSAFIQAIGLIWAGLVLGAGMIANVAVERAAHLYPVDPSGAADLWSILHAVELGLGGGNEIAGGVWIFSVSLLARRASMIAWPWTALGMLVGVAGLATLVPSLGDAAGAIFGLGAILWFAVFGFSMLWSSSRAKACP